MEKLIELLNEGKKKKKESGILKRIALLFIVTSASIVSVFLIQIWWLKILYVIRFALTLVYLGE